MQQSDVKDKLDRNAFVFTELDETTRITANYPGHVGAKTVVTIRRGNKTLHRSKHSSNAAAARQYVELVEQYE
jgi:hypothetical protein